ncbi:MAG TPA: hypothetical protein PLD54_03745 [Candidatus Levybacteria bacterium]|nr:hypothetical protein [Candidatus Levybacteria bacterium]
MIDNEPSKSKQDVDKKESEPVALNNRLRELYSQFLQKLITGPTQNIAETVSQDVGKRMRDNPEALSQIPLQTQIALQNHLYVSEAQFDNARDILDAIKSGITLSKTTPYYQEEILKRIVDETILPPDHHKEFPINFDYNSYIWGVAKEGEPGIFQLDTALPLELQAYWSAHDTNEFILQYSTTPSTFRKYEEAKRRLDEWEVAIIDKYHSVPGFIENEVGPANSDIGETDI